MSKKIIAFNWNNAKGEEYNGKHLVIGQHLPKAQNIEYTHIETYGITLDIPDPDKDFQLKKHSCYGKNLCDDIIEVTKSQAREMLITQIDKALDILFDENEMNVVNDKLNTQRNEVEAE